MMIGRSVGWMEWSDLVKGRAGDGDGDWEGEGRGEGEGSGNRSILYCSNMMTVLSFIARNKRVLLTRIIVHL